MTDYITYSADTATLIAEVEAIADKYVIHDPETGDVSAALTKTPTIRNSAETLAIVRDLPAVLQSLTNLTVLGTITTDADGRNPRPVLNDGAAQTL